MATKQEISVLMESIVSNRECFDNLPTIYVKWAIKNPRKAICLAIEAIQERNQSDTIIRVDRIARDIRLVYPEWMNKVMHLELEAVGPTEYDLSKIRLYLHDEQKDGKSIVGHRLYEHFKETNMIKNSLGFQDALEIQKKGIVVFQTLFGNKSIQCWKSVVLGPNGNLYVPCVFGNGTIVVVDWNWLDDDFNGKKPATRFAS